MAKTEVILISNIVGLGAESDHVKVAAGYARNYLFPRSLAIPLTSANKRRIEVLRQRRAEREAQEFNTMNELSKSISKLILVIKVKTGEEGKLYGAVTNGTISDELKQQFDIQLDKKKIHLEQPIRHLGEYEIELRLHQEITSTLKVRVESTTPPPEPTAEEIKAREAKESREGGRTDRRPRRTDSRAPVTAKATEAKPAAEAKPERAAKPAKKAK